MRSVLDSEIPAHTRPKPDVSPIRYDIPIEKKPEPEMATFVISGLRPQDDDSSIRGMNRGVHIVNVKPEFNRINGACMGTA